MRELHTTAALVGVGLSALSLPSAPALADIIQVRDTLQGGAPTASFTNSRVVYQTGTIGEDRIAMFPLTQTAGMSEQVATFRVQTAILAPSPIGWISNASGLNSQPWSVNLFIHTNDFDPLTPLASLISQQVIPNTATLPTLVGRITNLGLTPNVYEMTYNFTMPFLAEGSAPRSLLIGFGLESGTTGITPRFQIPSTSLSPSDPRYLAEGEMDYMFDTTQGQSVLNGWGPQTGRLPLAVEVNDTSVPTPGTFGLLALSAATIGACRRRRQ